MAVGTGPASAGGEVTLYEKDNRSSEWTRIGRSVCVKDRWFKEWTESEEVTLCRGIGVVNGQRVERLLCIEDSWGCE